MLGIRFDRKRIREWIWALLIIVVGVGVGRFIHSQLRAQEARHGRPIPYSVTLRETVYNPDGTSKVASDIIWAVRTDGSRVRRIKNAVGSERVVEFPSGLEVAINEGANTKTSMMKPNVSSARWQRDPQSKCLDSFAGKPMTSMPQTLIGEETVEGYRTVKIVSDIITSWYALDYGCALVKERWVFGTGEVSEKQLVALVSGEPNAALFDAPANAREVPPSERILGSQGCKSCDPRTAENFRKRDEEYLRLAVKPQ